jgi:hypothetical protein
VGALHQHQSPAGELNDEEEEEEEEEKKEDEGDS